MRFSRFHSAIVSIVLTSTGSIGLNFIAVVSSMIPVAQAQSSGQSVSTLRGCFVNSPFSGTIAFNPTNIRQQPTTDAQTASKFTRVGEVIQFSGINVGKAVNDAWDSQPDNMWYRIDGRGWVASAVVKGYPARGNCQLPQSNDAQKITDAVNRVNPDLNYRADRNWTYCNWFVADVLKLLNVEVPRVGSYTYSDYNSPVFGMQRKPWLAEKLFDYFSKGGDGKWRTIDGSTAITKANQGRVVVAAIGIPPGGSDGHIAIVVPGGSGPNVRVAQAGRINSKNISITDGFGGRTPRYFEYVGPR